jgi:transcriptional regulator with XRE-family HTH domain
MITFMASAAEELRNARLRAGISQRELARRLRTSQSAIARLEGEGSNPTVATIQRVLDATGHRLMLAASRKDPGLDESLIRAQLELTPEQRLRAFEAFNKEARQLMLAGARSRGEDPT